MSGLEMLLQELDAEVRIRDLLPVELDVGDLTLLAHLGRVDRLVGNPGHPKPGL